MSSKWYVIQDLNLSSLYLTFHHNSSTPNTDGELRIGLQQHHITSIPRTALDIHLKGECGAWPLLPIEIPADRLYLRWHQTEKPEFKDYIDLATQYFDGQIASIKSPNPINPTNPMWGFRMDSWGLVKSSRAIYKDHHHALSAMGRYGFKQHQLPFLVDIQAQIVSLSKSLSFGYIL